MIQKRPVSEADRPFLLALYATTRADELSIVPWTDDQKGAFVAMQFEAQSRWFRQVYADAEALLVLRDGEPIGRLIIRRTASELAVVDIALMPDHRGQGVGTRLLNDVLEAADRVGLPVALHVEPSNPARRLYERLGFEPRGRDATHERMVRPARQLNTAS